MEPKNGGLVQMIFLFKCRWLLGEPAVHFAAIAALSTAPSHHPSSPNKLDPPRCHGCGDSQCSSQLTKHRTHPARLVNGLVTQTPGGERWKWRWPPTWRTRKIEAKSWVVRWWGIRICWRFSEKYVVCVWDLYVLIFVGYIIYFFQTFLLVRVVWFSICCAVLLVLSLGVVPRCFSISWIPWHVESQLKEMKCWFIGKWFLQISNRKSSFDPFMFRTGNIYQRVFGVIL